MVHVLGIRHHGPGSARAVAAALEELQPDAVLIEGPADAGPLLPLAAHEEMQPPVALLAYDPAEPARAIFYPFAAFSPEWIALRWALAHGVDVRMIDLPAAALLAPRDDGERDDAGPRRDPLAALAAAAGYSDAERWWEDVVELRDGATSAFAAIQEAMGELRAAWPDDPPRELLREAHMRRAIRAAEREGRERVVVVCGAWHAPALAAGPKVGEDNQRLKGLPRAKAAVTWTPWTSARLAQASGYGAGVAAPGWYGHLFGAPDHAVARFLVRAARLLREEGLDVSSAHAIEATRLAETLAALRNRPAAGLDEVRDAVLAVFGAGSEATLRLVHDRLVVGEDLGSVPLETPRVPLADDLARLQRRLRMPPAAGERLLELDLRRDIDRDRSRLLHRLLLLDVAWGVPARDVRRTTGTFRETWRLAWRPELAVDVIAASAWGGTVEEAAGVRARQRADAETALPALASLLEQTLLADLAGATEAAVRALGDRAAVAADAVALMEALPPLARVARYGDVRGTDAERVLGVLAGMAERISVGLVAACSALDDEAADDMRTRIDVVHGAIALLDRPAEREAWHAALARLATASTTHGLVAGQATRLLLDGGRLDAAEAERRLAQRLSPGTEAAAAAAWLDGFLGGSGVLLLHDARLLGLIDAWLAALPDQAFTSTLPLVRRAFARFPAAERRQIGAAAARLTGAPSGPAAEPRSDVDEARAARVLPVLAAIMGRPEAAR